MKKCTETDNFARWPFIAEEPRADGERNNGGIDLIANPQQIDAIHEATDENGLKPLIKQLNAASSPFMTLGCASGQEDEFYFSYLEFTLRDPELARREEAIAAIEEKWETRLAERLGDHPEMASAIKSSVVWEYREFSLRNAPPQYLITVYLRARDAVDHGHLAGWVNEFFDKVIIGEINISGS